MAMWKDSVTPRQTPAPAPETREPVRFDAPPKPELAPVNTAAAPVARADTRVPGKESLIAADITIEGKIEGGGSGHIFIIYALTDISGDTYIRLYVYEEV